MTSSPSSHFDGRTYNPAVDQKRLSRQLDKVKFHLQSTGQWHTLRELALLCGGSEASISARIRDLRKPRFGGYIIERRHVKDGVWQYRMSN